MKRALLVLLFGVAAAALAPGAQASQLIDRNASNVELAVSRDGQALLTYRAAGQWKRVRVWGATNAVAPTLARPQVSFRLDYAGGRGWQSFENECGRYRGPALVGLVAACTARDGSHWAVQTWQRALPNYGLQPTAAQAVWDLRISHWTGPVAELDVWQDWVYSGRFHHLFGRLTYRGQAVHGFRSTRYGVPLDTFGRNLYLDTYNSAYGDGWRRENSFLAHRPVGTFCYGLYPFRRETSASGGRPITGVGTRYRITVIGPGVTPDIRWEGDGLPDYNPFDANHVAHELAMNRLRAEIRGSDRLCRQN